MRRCYQLKFNTAKRGFLRFKISRQLQSNSLLKLAWVEYPYLFIVNMRPSFGACAPPSPNSARNLYFLRRVRRLLMIFPSNEILSRRSRATFSQFVEKLIFSPQSAKTFYFPTRLLNRNGGECSNLADFIISIRLNWGKCRRRETLLSIEIQYGKEGLPQI